MQPRNREPRADDFIRKIKAPRVRVPDPQTDFGMYQRMEEAFDGLHEFLIDWQRNYGRVGYAAQNLESDLSKAYIEAVQKGDHEELAFIDDSMRQLAKGLNEAISDSVLPDDINRFASTVWQEKLEAELFGKIWPVVSCKTDSMPKIPFWKDSGGNVQAFVYGYLDVISELAKALTEELSQPMETEEEFMLFKRYLAVASSMALRLSQERHLPGYVINNGYGPWMSFSKRMRTVYGTIASVRRDYNLRLSIQRMTRENR